MATSVFENEKKFRKGKKFQEKETKGERIRKNLKEEIKKLDKIDKPKPGFTKPKKEKPPIDFKRRKPPNKPRRVPGEKKEMIPLRPEGMTPMAKGGRAMYKSGSKGCKLAMKGKGRAYGKNS